MGRPKSNRMATCHPDRKHAAKGLCAECYRTRYYAANRDYSLAKSKAWREANPERQRELFNAWYQANAEYRKEDMRQYTQRMRGTKNPQRATEVVQKSGGLCAICKQPEKTNRSIAADHCHQTGLVRDALCSACNTLVGHIENGRTKKSFPEHEAYIDYWRSVLREREVA